MDSSRKIELEEEKLRLEVKELGRPWLFKHLQTILTSVVALVGLWYTISTGFFDLQRMKLELQKDLLAKEILDFRAVRDSLIATNNNLRTTNVALGDSTSIYQRELAEARMKLQQYAMEVKKLKAQVPRPIDDPKLQAEFDSMMKILLTPPLTLEEEMDLLRRDSSHRFQ